MTNAPPPDTGYLIIVRANRTTVLYKIVPTFDFPASLTTDTAAAGCRFTDSTFDVTATIDVHTCNGDVLARLIARPGPCPLCHDRRTFIYRVDLTNKMGYAGELLHILLTEGREAAKNFSVVTDLTRPCPACRPAEYLTALNDPSPERDEEDM